MRKMITAATMLLTLATAKGQEQVDSSYANGYYRDRLAFFKQLPDLKKEIVFLGNSITEVGDWQEVIPGKNVVNRGISGDNSWGVLNRLDEVLSSRPHKIFLTIGVNDIKRGVPVQYIANNIRRIIAEVKRISPKTTLYVQSVLPVHEPMLADIYEKIRNEKIIALNRLVRGYADAAGVKFVDVYNEVFLDEKGQLKKELSTDGLHLKPSAYINWAEYLKKKKYL